MGGLVGTEDHGQFVVGSPLAKEAESLHRVARSGPIDLYPGDPETWISSHGRLAECGPHVGTRIVVYLPMGRLTYRHEQHPVQAQLGMRFLRADQMPQVRGVEDATQYPQPQRPTPAPGRSP